MINPINIAIAEDHLLMRQAMVCLMKTMNNINVLFDTDNSRDLFVKLRHSKPDIVLMDTELNLRDKQSLVKRILTKFPQLKLIIVSSAHSQNSITEFIHLGVRAFLPKNCDCFKVVDIINKVHLDGHYFDNKISLLLGKTERLLQQEKEKYSNTCKIHFTGRELEILNQICLNKTNKEIAGTLALSIRTVEGHRLNIMKKAHSKNVIDLTHFAMHYNLISR